MKTDPKKVWDELASKNYRGFGIYLVNGYSLLAAHPVKFMWQLTFSRKPLAITIQYLSQLSAQSAILSLSIR